MQIHERVLILLSCGLGTFVLMACLSPVDAGARSPRGTYKLTFDTSSSRSCSRSHASTTHKGTLTVTTGRSRAKMVMSEINDRQIGPSRGRYRAGYNRGGQVQRTRVRRRLVWEAKVQRSGRGTVTLALRVKKAKCTALPLYGTRGSRAFKCRYTPAVTLQCKLGRTAAYRRAAKGVYAPRVGKNEKSREVTILRCTSAKLPWLLGHARHQSALMLARNPGLRLYSRAYGYIGSGRTSILRR